MRRVVITGFGTVNPLGHSVEEFFKNALEGKNGISRIDRFNTEGFGSKIGGLVKDFKPEKRLDVKELKRKDLFSLYALYATQEAMEDSGLLDYPQLNKERVGVMIASGIGGVITLENEFRVIATKGPRRVSPFLVPMMIADMASGLVSMKYGFKGPNFAIVSACASSTHAIGESFHKIRHGYADVIITGGTEAPFTPLALAGFSNMRALSTRNDEPDKASRPFDAKRDGFVMAEGAGIIVLEELEHAKKRGAKIYAEIVGYGATADAYHITQPAPEGEGAYMSMMLAMKDAGMTPEDIDYINAHGTSTKLNDKFETIAIKRAFGERAYKIPVNSTKSMTGHMLGATGAAEFIILTLSVKNDVVHPTRNYEFKDPDCDLDYVPEGAREVKIRAGMSNSFGFGGHNATVIVKKFED